MNKDIVILLTNKYNTKSISGLDKFVNEQIKELKRKNILPICIFGLSMESSRFPLKRDDLWIIYINNNEKIMTTNQLHNFIFKLCDNNKNGTNTLLIHQLRFVNINELNKIINYLNCKIIFYIHDFNTLCVTHALIDPNDKFCEAKSYPNEKCKLCVYYKKDIMALIKDFFNKHIDECTCVAPSTVVKDIWLSTYTSYKKQVVVVPHQKLVGSYIENTNFIDINQPIKIAFIGAQKEKKGWYFFENAVNNLSIDRHNIQFYHFGKKEIDNSKIIEIETNLHQNGKSMIEQLRKHKIDVAVLWSILPETYSYTFYECLASNCFILTNNKSGNIAIQTGKYNNGIVLESLDGLNSLFEDETYLRKLVNEFKLRKQYGPESLEDNQEVLDELIYNESIYMKPHTGIILDNIYIKVYRLFIKLKKLL